MCRTETPFPPMDEQKFFWGPGFKSHHNPHFLHIFFLGEIMLPYVANMNFRPLENNHVRFPAMKGSTVVTIGTEALYHSITS